MARKFGLLLAAALVIAAALPLFLRGPDGRPLMTFADFVKVPARAANEAWNDATRTTTGVVTAAARAVGASGGGPPGDAGVEGRMSAVGAPGLVKYRNAHGNWVYAESAPAGVEAVPVDLEAGSVTVLDGDWVTVEPPGEPAAGFELPTNPLDAYGAAPQLMEEAKRLRETLDARSRELDALVSGESH